MVYIKGIQLTLLSIKIISKQEGVSVMWSNGILHTATARTLMLHDRPCCWIEVTWSIADNWVSIGSSGKLTQKQIWWERSFKNSGKCVFNRKQCNVFIADEGNNSINLRIKLKKELTSSGFSTIKRWEHWVVDYGRDSYITKDMEIFQNSAQSASRDHSQGILPTSG